MEKKRKFALGMIFLAALICPQLVVPIIEAGGINALAQGVFYGNSQ